MCGGGGWVGAEGCLGVEEGFECHPGPRVEGRKVLSATTMTWGTHAPCAMHLAPPGGPASKTPGLARLLQGWNLLVTLGFQRSCSGEAAAADVGVMRGGGADRRESSCSLHQTLGKQRGGHEAACCAERVCGYCGLSPGQCPKLPGTEVGEEEKEG